MQHGSPEQNCAISVLVPIYNVEKYLRECLDSIAVQTFDDFEVICINDGSTDSSKDIIEEFLQKDKRFRLIDKPNSGYGASMNQGLDFAVGEFVAIVESDDFIDINALDRLYKTAIKTGAQVVKANCWFYWSLPKERNEIFEIVPKSQTNRLINPQEKHEIFYLKPSIWSALYRRDFLNENAIRFLETPGASYQDAGFNFKVWTSCTRALFLHEAFLHYRQDNESSSVNSAAKVFCVNEEYKEMERYLHTCSPELIKRLTPVKTKMKYDSYMWNYERLDPSFQMEFLEQMREEFLKDLEDNKINWKIFEPWKEMDLKTLLRSKEQFHAERQAANHSSLLSKAAHYFRQGGLALLGRMIKQKLFGI